MNPFRFGELIAMIKVKKQMSSQKVNLREDQTDLKFCYDVLCDVSRSFATVTIQLHPELRDVVCIFYLVLRGLDTVEDDMSIPIDVKKEILPKFHEHLYEEDYHLNGIGEHRYRELLEKFGCVCREFMLLKKSYRDVISDICHKMALGMCHYLDHDVVTKKDYDMYCHYVAGLVGHGLTRLFVASGLEEKHLDENLEVANSMGLFLQKTNIIRDYFEDIVEEPPRVFWPKEIWGNFAERLEDFKKPECKAKGLECLNAMVADALAHIPHCIDYLASLRDPSVFLFCAIPQIMAIATLEAVYNNYTTFHDKVKIRKGLACSIMVNCTELEVTLGMFMSHVKALEARLNPEDPSYDTIRSQLKTAKQCIAKKMKPPQPSYARAFLQSYPALGGQLLLSVIDSVSGYFVGANQVATTS